MAAALEQDRVRQALAALIELLESVGRPFASYADGLRNLDRQVEEARDRDSPELLQHAVRNILRLYGGMGSFADLILQTPQGVALPEQDEFYALQQQLFEAARDELR
ncbi:unnamed protein product [[Actinomadura] parvosata subsp. kistnae]|uniref:DUF6966 domain-containing protein n=1 Tax=[Actinomadura] parvosata TaxID=1955412 RepID=UPI000D2C18CB|nr:hypothetical protein [Nonomuraea sp. ATCC 55076]SPL96381.1 unnamed protein product [Actinomadura parvosata subsp. kistnae]